MGLQPRAGVVAMLGLAAAGMAMAATLFPYQGLLTDARGLPLPDGSVAMRLAFYSAESGGQPLLTLTNDGVCLRNGRFSVLLGGGDLEPGSESDLDSLFAHHPAVWLDLSVDGAGLSPRTCLGAAPTALATHDGLPPGIVAMWSGRLADIPAGWSLCDGSGGTPDLRDRFVMGAEPGHPPGEMGGQDEVVLGPEYLLEHFHGYQIDAGGGHLHDCSPTQWVAGYERRPVHGLLSTVPIPDGLHNYSVQSVTSARGAHVHETTIGAAGGAPVSLLPAYYSVAYIVKQ